MPKAALPYASLRNAQNENTFPAKTNRIPNSYPYQFHIKVSSSNSTSNNLV